MVSLSDVSSFGEKGPGVRVKILRIVLPLFTGLNRGQLEGQIVVKRLT